MFFKMLLMLICSQPAGIFTLDMFKKWPSFPSNIENLKTAAKNKTCAGYSQLLVNDELPHEVEDSVFWPLSCLDIDIVFRFIENPAYAVNKLALNSFSASLWEQE